MIWYIIIYLIGAILAYYLLRYISRKDESLYNPYGWERVLINLIISMFSFVVVFTVLLLLLVDKVADVKSKPPKWL